MHIVVVLIMLCTMSEERFVVTSYATGRRLRLGRIIEGKRAGQKRHIGQERAVCIS